MSDWSEAEKEAVARAEPSAAEVWAVELSHSTFAGGVMRYVAYTQNLSLQLESGAPLNAGEVVEHTCLPFEVRRPALSDKPGETMRLALNSVAGAAESYLAAANATAEVIEAVVRAYDVDVLTHIPRLQYLSIRQQVRHISNDGSRLELLLGRPNAANSAFPSVLHTPESNPGLVQ